MTVGEIVAKVVFGGSDESVEQFGTVVHTVASNPKELRKMAKQIAADKDMSVREAKTLIRLLDRFWYEPVP